MSKLWSLSSCLGGLLRRFRVRPVSWLAAFAVVAAVVVAVPAAAVAEPGGGPSDEASVPETTSEPPQGNEAELPPAGKPRPDALGDLTKGGPVGPVAHTGAAVYEIGWGPGMVPDSLVGINGETGVGAYAGTDPSGEMFLALVVIDGPDDPTEYRFEGAVPAGHSAIVQPDGSVMVYRPDGSALVEWAVPWAFDSGGKVVETSFAVDGTTLVQTIDHSGASYPVVADPCTNLQRRQSARHGRRYGDCPRGGRSKPDPADTADGAIRLAATVSLCYVSVGLGCAVSVAYTSVWLYRTIRRR